jgi:acetyl esterase/lipase
VSALAQLTGEVALAREAVASRLRGIDPEDFASLRKAYDAFSANDPLPAGAMLQDFNLGGVNCLGVLPKGCGGDKVIFWLHGGGYVMGSSQSHKGLAGNIAEVAHTAAVLPDYRLAPEHHCPAALEDAVASYKAVLAEGVSPHHIVLAGDSAGGGLAMATALRLRAEGVALPAGMMLLSPWVNLANTGWSYDAKAARDPFITKRGLDIRSKQYLGEMTPHDPRAAILNGDLRGLPPAIIQVGEAEVLLSDSVALAERLGASGVPVTMEIWPDMFHVFQARYAMLSHGRQAIDRLGQWAAAHIRA